MTFVIAFVVAQAQARQDLVRLKIGGEIRCTIQRLDGKELVYLDAAGKAQRMSYEQVASYVLSDVSANLREADNALLARNYDKALVRYEEALREIDKKKLREVHKQFIMLGIAEAQRGKGKLDDAAETLKKIRKDFGDSKVRSETYRLSREIAKEKGGGGLADILIEMKDEPEPLGGQAKLELAKMKYEQNSTDQAGAIFKELSANLAQPYAEEARLWYFRCLRKLNKTGELEAEAKVVLAGSASSPTLQQLAGSAYGSILMARAEKDKTLLRDAILALAKAISAGPPEKSDKEASEDYAWALLNAARGYVMLARGAAKPEVQREYKERAIGYLGEIVRYYKASDPGKIADKELTALTGEAPGKDKEPGTSAPPKSR